MEKELSSSQGAWWHTARHGAGETAKSSTFGATNSKKIEPLGYGNFKSHRWGYNSSKRPSLLQSHISNLSQFVPLPDDKAFKYMSLWAILHQTPQKHIQRNGEHEREVDRYR